MDASNEIAKRLSHFLADNFVLYVKTLNFHWNMVGPEFFMYHKLLEEQYKELAEASDELAERIRMIGFQAPATMQEYLALTCLKEGKAKQTQDKMIADLVKDHESMVSHAHELIAFTDNAKDQGTSDLIIERLRFSDKAAWLLRSHLSKKR